MRYPIDQEIEAKKLIKKTKEILAKEKEEENIADFVRRSGVEIKNLSKKEVIELEKKVHRNYFLFFLFGFLSGLCIEIIVETLRK